MTLGAPVQVGPGQPANVVVEFDFKKGMPKDWSVVAQGESGAVKVSHSDSSQKTDQLPVLTTSGSTGGGGSDGTDGTGDTTGTDTTGTDTTGTDTTDTTGTDGTDTTDTTGTDGGDGTGGGEPTEG